MVSLSHHDLTVGGLLVSSFVPCALAAFLLLLVLRRLVRPLRLGRYVANLPLVEASVYVCLLALVIGLL
ncbi:DUF1656 domain-containing protein [uncultured Methylobacterium sp.]|jgi:hypothetical protein|uniref:DUF1656 domain-containing protein n=1 Tax=uncultured Methylobacterium sp. TaxID=157278 RepID=UPI002614647F|nr:DUF1656 domain-containing protein [uncultured Methylobacterium sp.]